MSLFCDLTLVHFTAEKRIAVGNPPPRLFIPSISLIEYVTYIIRNLTESNMIFFSFCKYSRTWNKHYLTAEKKALACVRDTFIINNANDTSYQGEIYQTFDVIHHNLWQRPFLVTTADETTNYTWYVATHSFECLPTTNPVSSVWTHSRITETKVLKQ